MREALVALGLVALGVVTLGTAWHGVEVQPGVWRDGVSPARWATFAILLVVVGAGVATRLGSWPRRVLVLVPLLAWVLWQLRAGTLWPIAFGVYGTGIVFCWLIGVGAGRWLQTRRTT